MEPTPDPAFPLLALPNDLADRVAYLLPLADRCGGGKACTWRHVLAQLPSECLYCREHCSVHVRSMY